MVLNLAQQGIKKYLKSLKFHYAEPVETVYKCVGGDGRVTIFGLGCIP